MIHLREQFFAVEVPENAENIRISQLIGTPRLFADIPGILFAIKLPLGTWSIVCTSKDVTYDQCGEIAGVPEADVVHGYNQTLFKDLLTSRGLDLNKQYLILKKQ